MEGIWKSLFEWSMQHQEPDSRPRATSDEDRQWLDNALRSAMIDLGKRMQDIKDSLDQPVAPGNSGEAASGGGGAAGSGEEGGDGGTSLREKEVLLDELMEIVESIDHAKDLETIGGLHTLLALLGSPHPSLRWRAAEVAATCAQNNPPVQRSFLDGGIMPRLEKLLRDDDATVRTKALLALSCMVRNFPPALALFRQQGGLQSLVQLLGQDEPRLQRKCLQVLQHMLRAVPGDAGAACAAGALPALGACLGSEDNDLRGAALALAREIAKSEGCLREMQEDCELREQIQALGVRLDALPQSEWSAVREEVEALTALASALSRELPARAAAPAPARAVVDNPATTGAAPAALQLVAVPATGGGDGGGRGGAPAAARP